MSNSHLSRGYELMFRDVVYKVDKKEILHGVSGSALPGQMLAIMGPSGQYIHDCNTGYHRVLYYL